MQQLEQLVRAGDPWQLLDTASSWDDKQRREAARWLAAQAKAPTTATYDEDGGVQQMQLLVAQAACVADPKKAFAIGPPQPIRHWETWDEYDAPMPVRADAKAALVTALSRRGREWAAAYVEAAAGGKRKKPMYADVLMALCEGLGLALPADGYLARSWAAGLMRLYPGRYPPEDPAAYRRQVARLLVQPAAGGGLFVRSQEATATSPLEAVRGYHGLQAGLAALLARRGDAAALAGRYASSEDMDLTGTIVGELAAAGDLDRAALVADCIAALTRGDAVGAQRMQARLLMAADPAPDLLAPHLQTLVNLLAGGHGVAAEAAQSLLVRADAAQPLDSELFTGACQTVFARKEKGLRREQLAWAVRRLKQHPAQAAATVQGMAEALLADDYALQKEAAGKLAAAWALLADDGKAALVSSVDAAQAALDAPLRAQLAAAMGVAAPAAPPTAAPAAAVPRVRTPVAPRRFARLPGYAQDPTASLHVLSQRPFEPGVSAMEQVVELAVRSAREGHREFAAHLAQWLGPPLGAGETANILKAHGPGHRKPAKFDTEYWSAERLPVVSVIARMRISEVLLALGQRRPYALLSEPSYESGAIEPADLAARLSRAAIDGLEIGPLDLLLALLRTLPADAAQLAAIRSAGSPQATAAADFLAAGGMSQMTTSWQRVEPVAGAAYGSLWVNSRSPEVCVTLHGMPVLPAIDGIPVTWSEGFTPETAPDIWEFDILERFLGAVMPNSGEVLAAQFLWGFRKACHDDNTTGGKATAQRLPLFLAAGGPAGPALHLAVLFTMSSNDAGVRVVGSDGLLALLEQGRFDSQLAQELVAACLQCGSVKAGRLAASLARVADAGEEAAVWPLVRAAIAAVLCASVPPPGSADLLALASRLAPALGIREPIGAVAALAAAKGSAKLAVEARRLHTLLASA